MKIVFATTLTLLAACALQAAKDDKLAPIPKEKEGRYGVFSMAEAKEEAKKKKQPIAVLVQDARTEEAAEKEAGLKAFWGVQKDATMVVTTGELLSREKERLGAAVVAGANSAEMGKKLPKLIVLTQDGTGVLGAMNMEQILAADEKALKAFAKQMEDDNKDPAKVAAAVAKATAPAAAPGAPAAPATPAAPGTPAATTPAAAAGPVAIKDAKPESWTNAQGQAIQATLVEVDGDKLTLLMANGTKVPYDMAKLSDASKKRVEELKAASK